jgi:ketosteroid isomerase-like protein
LSDLGCGAFPAADGLQEEAMTSQEKNRSEAEVRQLIDIYLGGVQNKDIARVMSCYAPDVTAFDVMPPLQYTSAAAYQKSWEMAFSMTDGQFRLERRDLTVAASADVAFAHAIDHLTVSPKGADRVEMWMRWTACFRRLNGGWKIVHEHGSVPVDMETSKAVWDLKPG